MAAIPPHSHSAGPENSSQQPKEVRQPSSSPPSEQQQQRPQRRPQLIEKILTEDASLLKRLGR